MQDNTCVCCGSVIPEGRHICLSCGDYDDQQRFKPDTLPIVRTNGDRIRQMTDEEIVKSIGLACKRCVYHTARIGECANQDCTNGNLEWLKQEVSEDAES